MIGHVARAIRHNLLLRLSTVIPMSCCLVFALYHQHTSNADLSQVGLCKGFQYSIQQEKGLTGFEPLCCAQHGCKKIQRGFGGEEIGFSEINYRTIHMLSYFILLFCLHSCSSSNYLLIIKAQQETFIKNIFPSHR